MPKRNLGLKLPQGLIDQAESSGGSAGEMMSMAPLPVWGGAAPAGAPSQPQQQQQQQSSPPDFGSPLPAAGISAETSPGANAKTRAQLEAFNSRPEDERVHELSTALLREFLAKHAGEVPELREAFEKSFPRTENTVNRRSVICAALNAPEPPKNSPESLLESLVRRSIAPPATSITSGVFSVDTGDTGGDPATLGGTGPQSSLRFDMSPDGLGVNVNGLAVGQNTSMHMFRVKELAEIDLDRADIVGKGAGGRVLRARHVPTGELLAVKEIYLGSDDVIKQIEAEISVMWGTSNRYMHTIPSPFLVNCQGIFYRDGTLYIVMELMDGSLKDALDVHGPFKEEQLKAMTYQMLHGLQYMHFDKKQLHRDIKPHNVLYNRSGWVKLSDFGIASDKMATMGARSHQTFCGTLVYMSPNRAEGDSYGYEADIWSLGVTLYQMALGRLPTANNLFEVIQLKSDPPQLPADGAFSDDFRDFITTCLDPQANAATTVTVRQLLLHPWVVRMTLERSQKLVHEVFQDVLTRTQRNAAGHKPVGFGQRDDIFATLDEVIS
eukprot:CAMPEP_0174831374 /NCGR_PEP_ID=MMETSP1114-20130205/3054_1 /TAXON_ID=312471 /ORGANISM="Neobodo designis, Strain CCAP 1951/1" /LENGTH=551 /DNA_ID=CAMNT_0016065197 /DNA_START=29 /DNA_END=1684 /DNA_ORIENTATION=+